MKERIKKIIQRVSIKPKYIRAAVVALIAAAIAATAYWEYMRMPHAVEMALRMQLVEAAEQYLGCMESDGSHVQIIDLYNSHLPRPRGYKVTETDSWCAVFVSAAAIETGMTEILPPECSCEQQIYLFQALGRWEERDTYIPQTGDVIYYDWSVEKSFGDCTGWADHVGIVVDTFCPFIKVIEGNYSDSVKYRYLLCNDLEIRGYGLPDFNGHIR